VKLSSVHVLAFRNLADLKISPSEGVNVIYGDNGQGKTNLMEAVWLFTGARSFRGAKESEQIAFGEKSARAQIAYRGFGRENTARVTLGVQKSVFFNDVELEGLTAMAGNFNAVVFSPAHLTIIQGGPAQRRRAMDGVISQIRPRYRPLMAQYARQLVQRNTLLRDAKTHAALLDTLDVWDQSLAKTGALIMRTRMSYIRRLEPFAKRIYAEISNGREEFSMAYAGEFGDISDDGLEDALREQYQKSRAYDLRTASTGSGPHRDDLDIRLDGTSARTFGSQGQQRSCVLALKLAECGLMEVVTGESPVVLLDDVMSELDGHRREYLLQRLGGRQIFMTCCEPKIFALAPEIPVFHIKEGKLTQ
jgi:DNA replication and repair protein RecF